MKSVVFLHKVFLFLCYRLEQRRMKGIRSVGPSQPEMMGLPTGLGLCIFVGV